MKHPRFSFPKKIPRGSPAPEAASPFQETPALSKTGKLSGESTIAYSITLPDLPSEESRAFLEELTGAYLSFLEK